MQPVGYCLPPAGTCFGVLDTFLFWLLQDLGAKKFLMGITVTVGYIAGIPVLIASGFIFKKFGFPNTIVFGFAVYVIRWLGEWRSEDGWKSVPELCGYKMTVIYLLSEARDCTCHPWRLMSYNKDCQYFLLKISFFLKLKNGKYLHDGLIYD